MSRHGAPTSHWQTFEPEGGSGKVVSVKGATLLVRRPGLPEVRIEIGSGLVIGRSAALADLVLDDDLVSRKHARLHVDPRGYYRLEDLGSRNGIRFAERTIRRLNLVDGDIFYIGKTELAFFADMPRLGPMQPQAPLRADTLLVDAAIKVPEPEPEPNDGVDGFDQLGWNARSGSPSLEAPAQKSESSDQSEDSET